MSATHESIDETVVSHAQMEESEKDKESHAPEKDIEKQEGPAPTADDFPEGGLEAYGVVLGAALVLFCTLGNVNAYGVLQAYYQTHQLKEVKSSVVALIGSFQLFILYGIAPFIGVAFDRHGPKPMMWTGTFIFVFGLMMQSLCTEYYQFFLAQAIVVGFGASLTFWPALSAVNHWFKRKRGFALGLVVGGSSIGGAVLPILYNKLFVRVGFGWTVRIAAFIAFGLLIIANFLVKARLPPRKGPQAMFDLDGFKDPRYSLVFCGTFCIILGLFVPFFYIQPYGQQLGVDENLAFYLVSILNGASFFGRVVTGSVADKFGRFNCITICSFIAGIVVLAFWLSAKSSGAIIGFAATYGFFSGSVISLQSAVVAQISPIERIGARLGTIYGPIAIATLVGTPIAGALYTNYGGYGPAIIFAGVAIIVGSFFLLAARVAYTRDPFAKV